MGEGQPNLQFVLLMAHADSLFLTSLVILFRMSEETHSWNFKAFSNVTVSCHGHVLLKADSALE